MYKNVQTEIDNQTKDLERAMSELEAFEGVFEVETPKNMRFDQLPGDLA